MKKYKIYNISLLFTCLMVALLWSSCSKEEVIERNYLNLSLNAFTFDAAGSNELMIEINSNPIWDIQKGEESDWLEEVERTDTHITYRATQNMGISNRSTDLTVIAGSQSEKVSIKQLEDYSFSKFKMMDEAFDAKMSFNGEHVAMLVGYMSAGSATYELYRIDTRTGEREMYRSSGEKITLSAISDEGAITALFADEMHIATYTKAETFSVVDVPEEYIEPAIHGFSADGKILVGSVKKVGTKKALPARWVNGDFEELPLPERNIYDKFKYRDGGMALGCSEDGSVIYGATDTEGVGIYWKNGEANFMGRELAKEATITFVIFGYEFDQTFNEGLRSNTAAYGISPNGKYVALQHHYVVNNEEQACPAIFNTETGETLLISLDQLPPYYDKRLGAGATYVTNDMNMFVSVLSSQGAPVEGYYIDLTKKELGYAAQYITNEYGVIVKDKKLSVKHISTDGKEVFGTTVQAIEGDMYLIPWYTFK